MAYTKLGFAAVLAVMSTTGAELKRSSGVVVHEWGTFTSVASETGNAVHWAPLAGPADLPCFVDRYQHQSPKTLTGKIRMETPVLYFYSDGPATLSVSVRFPQGWITEWYPQASRISPPDIGAALPTGARNGSIRWDQVEVLPKAKVVFPRGAAENHYYAARETSADPIRVGAQTEKFLFYRGIGDFDAPVRPAIADGGRLRITNAGEKITRAVVFENRRGRMGYRVVRDLEGTTEIDRPELTGTVEALRGQLVSDLVNEGLYEKEAMAMVETWRDSWFEEGLRVLYIVPRSLVDAVLPLDIKPAPASIERVFVGRVEVLSPETAAHIAQASANGDARVFETYGRFLHPFLAQMERTTGRRLQTEAFRVFQKNLIDRRLSGPGCVQ